MPVTSAQDVLCGVSQGRVGRGREGAAGGGGGGLTITVFSRGWGRCTAGLATFARGLAAVGVGLTGREEASCLCFGLGAEARPKLDQPPLDA